MIKKPLIFKIIILCSFIIVTGCQTIFDCIVGIKPDLISKELATGSAYHNYAENVIFEMEHADTGDYFITDLSIEGNLPPGIESSFTQNTITFIGIPTSPGEFEFTVKIIVSPYTPNSDETDDLCGNASSKQYKIIID
jgi:hypothetical protein